jgi:hypothetical protein
MGAWKVVIAVEVAIIILILLWVVGGRPWPATSGMQDVDDSQDLWYAVNRDPAGKMGGAGPIRGMMFDQVGLGA